MENKDKLIDLIKSGEDVNFKLAIIIAGIDNIADIIIDFINSDELKLQKLPISENNSWRNEKDIYKNMKHYRLGIGKIIFDKIIYNDIPGYIIKYGID